MYPQFWTSRVGAVFMKYRYKYKKKCVKLYRQGKWPETPEGVSVSRFHHAVVEWTRLEKACGSKVLKHKNKNKAWSAPFSTFSSAS